MTFETSRLGLVRNVLAATLTAFLDTVAELAEDRFGHVERVLGHEIDADTLGADEPYDLLDLVFKNLQHVVEQEVGFVKEEDQLRFFRITYFGQCLEKLGQHPKQEGGVELRRLHELVRDGH